MTRNAGETKNNIMNKFILGIISLFFITSCAESTLSPTSQNPQSSNGTNGSYSQIIVNGDFLYGIVGNEISTLNIADKENIKEIDSQILAYDIESIFINNQSLFVGSASRFYIFDINSETGIPTPVTEQDHNIGFLENSLVCLWIDPIIADGDYAYVTLRGSVSNICRTELINQLRVFNITDIENPILINITEMEEPKGLGKDGNTLFVCDGFNGLKIYDVTTPSSPVELYHFDGFDSYDLIVKNGLLQVVAEDQLLQYDYTDLEDIKLLSSIDL